ncbi:MAG: hypothetical protein FWH57_03120 [Oscillospiraceae bacterium]|nr:hypothetical protein [Oscillospiraceae bacterium]
MIKRLLVFSIFFIVLILFSMFLTMLIQPVVYADVVNGNAFLNKNSDKTERIGDSFREFYVDSPSGYVIPKEKPGSKKGIVPDYSENGDEIKYNNGEKVLIYNVCLYKGEYWGIPPTSHAYSDGNGWIRMDELAMIYDNNDFIEEHQGELYRYRGGFDELLEAEGFYIWQWPGSDREKIHATNTLDLYVDPNNRDSNYYGYSLYQYIQEVGADDAFTAGYGYEDEEGRQWVYIEIFGGDTLGGRTPYGRGGPEGWLCLSDLNNDQIPAFNPAQEPKKWSHTNNMLEELYSSHDKSNITPIIVAAVIVLSAGAFVLIWLLRKKKQ